MLAKLQGSGKTGKQRGPKVTFPPGITWVADTRINYRGCGCVDTPYHGNVKYCHAHRTCLSAHGRIRKDLASASALGR